MAEGIVNISSDKLNNAALRISSANAIVTALGIFLENTDNEDLERPSGQVLNNAFFGASLLLEDAYNALLQK
jgi:hypothetical protein